MTPPSERVISAFLITHAHLDHIMGLVLLAGTLHGGRKSLMGATQTLKDLESVFQPSRVWPNLASWERNDSDHLYLYDPYVVFMCMFPEISQWLTLDYMRQPPSQRRLQSCQ